VEPVKCRLDRAFASQRREEHLRMLIVAAELNIGDRHQFDTWVLEITAYEFRQFSLNLISETPGTGGILSQSDYNPKPAALD
jgi:hypothetical protein